MLLGSRASRVARCQPAPRAAQLSASIVPDRRAPHRPDKLSPSRRTSLPRVPFGFSNKLLEHRAGRQFVQQFPRRIRAGTARAQSLACRAEPFEPYFIFRTELCFEFLPKALRERGALAIRGDCDLQIAALNDSSVIKVAMTDVVDGIAQQSAGLRLAKDGFVYAWGGSRRYYQKCAVQIRGLKFFGQPIDFSKSNPFGNLWRDGRREQPDSCPSGQQPGNL